MLEKAVSAAERWSGVDRVVTLLLKERQELLVLYCASCGVQPVVGKDTGNCFESGNRESGRSPGKLKKLCDILVDYVSVGHFEVYEQLLREADAFQEDGISVLARYYPVIERSTEIALSFSDKYVESTDYRELSRDLSRLGETLEARFEAEDLLIESMHTVHRKQVAA